MALPNRSFGADTQSVLPIPLPLHFAMGGHQDGDDPMTDDSDVESAADTEQERKYQSSRQREQESLKSLFMRVKKDAETYGSQVPGSTKVNLSITRNPGGILGKNPLKAEAHFQTDNLMNQSQDDLPPLDTSPISTDADKLPALPALPSLPSLPPSPKGESQSSTDALLPPTDAQLQNGISLDQYPDNSGTSSVPPPTTEAPVTNEAKLSGGKWWQLKQRGGETLLKVSQPPLNDSISIENRAAHYLSKALMGSNASPLSSKSISGNSGKTLHKPILGGARTTSSSSAISMGRSGRQSGGKAPPQSTNSSSSSPSYSTGTSASESSAESSESSSEDEKPAAKNGKNGKKGKDDGEKKKRQPSEWILFSGNVREWLGTKEFAKVNAWASQYKKRVQADLANGKVDLDILRDKNSILYNQKAPDILADQKKYYAYVLAIIKKNPSSKKDFENFTPTKKE
jgi:hypothetical protein